MPQGNVAFNIDGNYIRKGRNNLGNIMFTIDGNYIRKGRSHEIAFVRDGSFLKKPNGEIAFTIVGDYIVMVEIIK